MSHLIKIVVTPSLIVYIIAIWDQLNAAWVNLIYEIGDVDLNIT